MPSGAALAASHVWRVIYGAADSAGRGRPANTSARKHQAREKWRQGGQRRREDDSKDSAGADQRGGTPPGGAATGARPTGTRACGLAVGALRVISVFSNGSKSRKPAYYITGAARCAYANDP